MLVKTYCAEVMGLEATTITIEVNMTRGVQFHLSGLADTAVKESYDRIRAAIANNGFKPPTADLTINLSPADIRISPSTSRLPTSGRKAAATTYRWPSASSQPTERSVSRCWVTI